MPPSCTRQDPSASPSGETYIIGGLAFGYFLQTVLITIFAARQLNAQALDGIATGFELTTPLGKVRDAKDAHGRHGGEEMARLQVLQDNIALT